eukprot:scaffold42675_cov30-Tisochrysis_lutea.AAC.3
MCSDVHGLPAICRAGSQRRMHSSLGVVKPPRDFDVSTVAAACSKVHRLPPCNVLGADIAPFASAYQPLHQIDVAL